MRELRFLALLRKEGGAWDLRIPHRENVLTQLIEYFVRPLEEGVKEIWFEAILKPESRKKTSKQMGYYRAEVQNKALYGFRQAGYEEYDLDDAHYILRKKFYYKLTYDPDTGEYDRRPLSLENANSKEMSNFLKLAIPFIENDLGVKVLTSEEYKRHKRAFDEGTYRKDRNVQT